MRRSINHFESPVEEPVSPSGRAGTPGEASETENRRGAFWMRGAEARQNPPDDDGSAAYRFSHGRLSMLSKWVVRWRSPDGDSSRNAPAFPQRGETPRRGPSESEAGARVVPDRRAARFWLAVEIACFSALAVLLAVIGLRLAQNAGIRAEERASTGIMTATAAPPAQGEAAAYRPPAEFEDLRRQNPDFVGMISFEDKSLYVCQTYNNQFYMNHKFDGSEDAAGMIFMDCRCRLNPRCDNLILYGHNMKNGSRFGTLKRFEKQGYLEKYPRFRFDGMEEGLEYLPIAVFYVSVDEQSEDYFDFQKIDFADEADFDQTIAAIRQRALYSIDIDVEYGERLLTLATCSNALEDGRLVIVCRAARAGE